MADPTNLGSTGPADAAQPVAGVVTWLLGGGLLVVATGLELLRRAVKSAKRSGMLEQQAKETRHQLALHRKRCGARNRAINAQQELLRCELGEIRQQMAGDHSTLAAMSAQMGLFDQKLDRVLERLADQGGRGDA